MVCIIKKENCIGCGICQSICPECFSIKNGIAEISTFDLNSCNLEEVIESCPCQAIFIKK